MAIQAAKADIAMARISVKGNVTSSQFLAGYSAAGADVNPDAQIGTVTVGGNWTASDLVAGVAKGGNVGFGDPLNIKASGPDNAAIISRIASISIVGTATAAGENVTHAFTAQQIVKMKVGAIGLPFDATPANQSIEVGGPSANLLAREIAL